MAGNPLWWFFWGSFYNQQHLLLKQVHENPVTIQCGGYNLHVWPGLEAAPRKSWLSHVYSLLSYADFKDKEQKWVYKQKSKQKSVQSNTIQCSETVTFPMLSLWLFLTIEEGRGFSWVTIWYWGYGFCCLFSPPPPHRLFLNGEF